LAVSRILTVLRCQQFLKDMIVASGVASIYIGIFCISLKVKNFEKSNRWYAGSTHDASLARK